MSQFRTRAAQQNAVRRFSRPFVTARGANFLSALAFLMLLLSATAACAQAGQDGGKNDSKSDSNVSRLRIEVTGGDQNKPIADASVYVKFSEDRKILKDKHYELSLKTNEEGVARSPDIPKGKTLIQIIAPGWKTYGEWFDVNQSEQTIAIHLVRPVKPY